MEQEWGEVGVARPGRKSAKTVPIQGRPVSVHPRLTVQGEFSGVHGLDGVTGGGGRDTPTLPTPLTHKLLLILELYLIKF